MSQKVPLNGFKWFEDLPKFDGSFIKNYVEKCKEGYFLELYL